MLSIFVVKTGYNMFVADIIIFVLEYTGNLQAEKDIHPFFNYDFPRISIKTV